MPTHQILAMLIEDDPDDVLLLKESLVEVGLGKIKLDCADRLSRGLIQLSGQSYDVVLLDLNLPDSRGLDTLTTTITRFPRIPVVVLSGLDDDAITVEAVRRGAQDYLVKGDISGPLVMRVVRYAIERKQVEAVLRASEARYRTLVETSPDGITLADLEGKLLLCNQQAARLYGYAKPEAMLGINVFKFISAGDRRYAVLNTQRALNENRVINAEYTLSRREGTQFPAEISTAVLRNSQGAPTGFISIIRDITEHKKALQAEKQLLIMEKEFISGVSRELHTPLDSLMEYLDLLRRAKIRETSARGEFLAHASMNAQRILDIVEELSDFSLLESSRLNLNWEKSDLARLIIEVLESYREQAAAKQVALRCAPIESSLVADMDPARIRRVLSKLVDHAINSSNPMGKVLVAAKSMNGEIQVNIMNEGNGLSVEDSSRIFDKYYQVKLADGEKTRPTGFGLYISRQIIEAHHGTLSVSSQLGAGSTYKITLPLVKKLKSIPKSH